MSLLHSGYSDCSSTVDRMRLLFVASRLQPAGERPAKWPGYSGHSPIADLIRLLYACTGTRYSQGVPYTQEQKLLLRILRQENSSWEELAPAKLNRHATEPLHGVPSLYERVCVSCSRYECRRIYWSDGTGRKQ